MYVSAVAGIAAPSQAGRGVVTDRRRSGRADGRAARLPKKPKRRAPLPAAIPAATSKASPPLTAGSVWTQTYLPPFLTSMAAWSASVRKRLPGTAFLPLLFQEGVCGCDAVTRADHDVESRIAAGPAAPAA